MNSQQTLLKELIKKGYSMENGVKVWDLSKRCFRYVNLDMAKAFLKLQEHPRYKATVHDIEIRLLKEHIPKLQIDIKDNQFNLIDMSCIDGEKAKVIINALPKNIKLRYCPVSVSEYLTELALKNIKKEKLPSVVDYTSKITEDFQNLDNIGAVLRNNKYQRNIILLLNSFLASFEISDYLFRLSQSMLPGDILIIGNGIRTGPRFANLETYQHPIFNDWLIHITRQLGFEKNEVEYNARFANNRLEVYYKIKKDKTLLYEKRKIELRKNDEIIVAFQYKLYENELKEFCDMYFDSVELKKDAQSEYALVLCKR